MPPHFQPGKYLRIFASTISLLLLTLISRLNGQNPVLLSEVSVAQAQLTGTEQAWLSSLQNSAVANSVRIVAIGNVLELSQNGSVHFSIPGYPGILTVHTVQVEEHWNTTGIFSVFDPFGGVANGGTYLGNSQCINLGNLACNSYWLQLTVTSSDGLTVRTKRRIKTKFCEDCLERNTFQTGGLTLGAKASLIPNPAAESVQVVFKQEQTGPVRIALFSIAGDLVFETRAYFEAGENSLTVEIGQLPAGVYPVRIEYPSGTETLRLSILH